MTGTPPVGSPPPPPLDGGAREAEFRRLLEAAIEEDLGSQGDLTTAWTIGVEHRSRATVLAKESLVPAGITLAREVFLRIDRELDIDVRAADGHPVERGGILLTVAGRTHSILAAERIALNFLGRLSGVATLTAAFVREVEGTSARILDTRKTTPGWRHLEKWAVRVGGGANHRLGLYDMILLKENHVAAAGGVGEAARQIARSNSLGLPVEVEVVTPSEVEELRGLPVDRILLDNMSPEAMREAVARVGAWPLPRPELEASGNMTLQRVREVALTGVGWISVGALTHSARTADLSLLLEGEGRARGRVAMPGDDLAPTLQAPPLGPPPGWEEHDEEGWARFLGVPGVHLRRELPSTNTLLREMASRGPLPPFTLLLAGTQSAGRGRGGNRWYSPEGSGLWLSILLPVRDPARAGLLPLAVGVATARAIESSAPQVGRLSLKWPNDLFLGERKVAGILCEATADFLQGIVVGIGINLRRPVEGVPPEVEGTIAFLEEAGGGKVMEAQLLRSLVEELRRWTDPLSTLLEGGLREEWEARDYLRERRIHLLDGPSGVAHGIAPDGALELRLEDGRIVAIRSGTVRLEEVEGGGEGGSGEGASPPIATVQLRTEGG